MVVRPNVGLYLDPGKAQEACGKGDTIPVGTPVGPPLETSDRMVRVNLLDSACRWAPPARCDGVHAGPVWIEKDAIGTEYPSR